MSVIIRAVDHGDEAHWRRLFADYIAFYEADVPEHVIALTWQRLVEQRDGMVALLAVTSTDDDNAGVAWQAVGLANLVFHRSTWSPTWYCYLEDLFVDEVARGQGVAQALIEAAEREANKRGATRTYWVTDHSNARARRLYDRVASLSQFIQYRR